MKKIYGRVLVKESNAGVPNLVVAAYDSESDLQKAVAIGPANAPAALLTERLGKRIGSVLTGSDGAFIFSFDELHFTGTEARPDLLLIVFAPEDVQGIESPYPLPPEQRVLYISRVARSDAGAEESYFIRLLQGQLDKFNIPTSSTAASPKTAEINNTNIFNAVENFYNSRESLKRMLAPRLKAQVYKTTGFRNQAKEKLKNFSAIPLPLRNSPLLLKDLTQLDTVQRGVLDRGLTRLSNYQGSVQLSLTPDELSSLKLQQDSSGESKGQVNANDLIDLIVSKTGGLDLVRVAGSMDNSVSLDALSQKYSLPAGITTAPPPPGSTPAAAGTGTGTAAAPSLSRP